MDYNQILDELKSCESEKIECKTSLREEEIGRTIAAFATKKGGKIYFGITDRREAVGIVWGEKFNDRIMEVARACMPSISINIETIQHDKEKVIGCVFVPKGDGRVYTYKKVAYERREGVNHPLSPEEIIDIEKRNKKLHFDEMPARSRERPGLTSDIDTAKVLEFIKNTKGSLKEGFDLKQFLINHELMINGSGKVRNAAIMLFGKNVPQFLPQNKISISIFPSEEITEQFVKKEISGDLVDMVVRTFLEMERNIRMFSFVAGLQRIDIPEYPPEIIREGIINAIAHRDYFIETSEIFIKVFSNRIEIINPGGFPFSGYSWGEIEKSGLSIRRNPIIADFLEKLHFMEQEGHGIKRIKEKAKLHGLPEPKIEVTSNTFKITFFGVGQDETKILNSPFKKIINVGLLNERQIKLLQQLKKGESISRVEYRKQFDIPERTAARDLINLLRMGLLIRIGSKRGTRYLLK